VISVNIAFCELTGLHVAAGTWDGQSYAGIGTDIKKAFDDFIQHRQDIQFKEWKKAHLSRELQEANQ
jgi:hypothetical protein